MELIVNTSSAIQNPTIPARWCLSQEELELLKEEGAPNIHILLVVLYENGKEERFLIPWKQVMTYVEFKWPGKSILLAQVVRTEDEHLLNMQKFYLEKSHRYEYDYDIFEYGEKGKFRDLEYNDYGRMPETRCEVEVSKEFFAKQPPEWLRRWANLWFDYSAIDQCQLRRRMILALTAQPICVFLWLIGRSICAFGWIAFLFLGGLRRIKFSVLAHPWKSALGDIHHDCRRYLSGSYSWDSWFRFDGKEEKRPWYWLLIHPFLLLPIITIMEIVRRTIGFSDFLKDSASPIVAILVFVAIVFFGVWCKDEWDKRSNRKYHEKMRRKRDREAAQVNQLELLRQKEFDLVSSVVACSATPREVSLETLPPQMRTFRLRYLDLKARLCRPFAG